MTSFLIRVSLNLPGINIHYHFILLSSKNSTTELRVQTAPAVKRPSKKIPKYPTLNKSLVIPPNVIDRKNPTHVAVQRGQLINSPKNLECFVIRVRSPSKIDPYTIMVVIPYAIKVQNINNPIIIKYTDY